MRKTFFILGGINAAFAALNYGIWHHNLNAGSYMLSLLVLILVIIDYAKE